MIHDNVEGEFDKQYSDQAQYGRIHFWDEWYTSEPEPFEWYYPYKKFASVINDHVAKEAKILVAGCGNSYMMEDMVADEFVDITGVDISRVVIDLMKVRCADYPEIRLLTGNMQDTNLPKESFDCIIDKGLMDSILCDLKGEEGVQNLVREVERLLTPDGIFICISHAGPEDRLQYLEVYDIDSPLFTPWYTDVIGIR
ncbi:Eef1akmt4, partial [Symbiodinium microadriaticum]